MLVRFYQRHRLPLSKFSASSRARIFRQIRWPAVGGGDGGGELLVGQGQPGGAFVVELGQGALLQLLGAVVVLGGQARVADGAEPARVGVVDVARPGAGGRAGGFQQVLRHPVLYNARGIVLSPAWNEFEVGGISQW